MSNEITSTSEIDESNWDGHSEPSDVGSDIVATKDAEGRGIEFHVSMRDYTQRDMEGLIVEAAAQLIVGKHNDRDLARAIEAKCIEQIHAKTASALEGITTEIVDRPLTPAFGEKKPVTMREYIGLLGREYLEAKVKFDGSPYDGNGWGTNVMSRAEWFARKYMESTFEREITKATNAAITEVRRAVEAQHKAFLEAEKARFRDALAKTVTA